MTTTTPGRWLLPLVLFWGIAVMALRAPLDSDMFWHLRAGHDIIAQEAVPHTDPYSITRGGQPWVDHGWPGQVLLAVADTLGGYRGVALLTAALILLAMAIAYRQPGASSAVRAICTLFAALASSIVWAPRPHLISLVMAAVFCAILADYRWRGRNRLWLLPPLFLLWVNAHGGFVIGLVLLAVYFAGELLSLPFAKHAERATVLRRLQAMGITTLVCAAVIPMNPYGVQMYTYALQTAGMEVSRVAIQEWASPDFHVLAQQPFIWMFLLTLAGMAFSRKVAWVDVLLVAVFAYIGLMASRNVGLFAVVAVGPMSRAVSGAVEALRAEWRWSPSGRRAASRPLPRAVTLTLNTLIVLLLLALGIVRGVVALSPTAYAAEEARLYPKEAVDYLLANHPPGVLFNSYNWGGYLIWRAYPEVRVFVDGRADLYGDALLGQYMRVVEARDGWEEILEQYGVRTVLIERDAPIAAVLPLTGEWRTAYRDDLAIVLVKD